MVGGRAPTGAIENPSVKLKTTRQTSLIRTNQNGPPSRAYIG